jgi:hypothetical protein
VDNLNKELPRIEKHPEITLPDIEPKLSELKLFETDLRNPEVEKAKIILHEVFDPQFEWFNSRNIIVTYHGSLQYSDPKNLDVDISFIGDDKLTYGDMAEKEVELENEFQKKWPRKKCETDFSILTIKDIKDESDKLKRQFGEEHMPNGEDDDIFPPLQSAIILSSKLLYESQKPLLLGKENEVRKIIAEDEWLRREVGKELDGVIGERKKRRKIKNITKTSPNQAK